MGVPGVLVASGWGSDNASEGTSQSMSSTPLDSRDRKVAVTLVDHVPESLSELSFKRGDSIRDIAPAWPRGDQVPRGTEEIWRGKLRGREGTFRRAHVCMSTLIVPLAGVQHGDGVVDDEYDTSNATLLNSCHGFEVFACSPLDGGARVRIAIMRTDSAEWRARSERQLSLMEEMSAIGCGHLIPLLRVVRPPREKRLVMVMPHMAGGDLFDRLERHGPVQEEQARSIAMQLLSGVAQLHGRHILHGDLQPAALLFESTDAQNPAMRIDVLRTCRRLPPSSNGMGALEGACGRPDYLSPEMLSWHAEGVRSQQYGLQSDVWSVGVLLYVMLCGFAPFQGESPADIYKACASRKLEFPAVMADGRGGTSWPRVSPAAKRMIEQLLQQDPSARPTAEVALQDPWITGDYDSSAVRATIATLRSRFLGWSQLQPSVEVPLPRRSDDETTLRPPRPRQINAPETPKLSFGHLSRWLMGRFGKRRHLKVLLLGLDSAGKSTLLQRLKDDTSSEPLMPTIGYDVEEFEHGDVVYSLYDVGGQRQSRLKWRESLGSGVAWSQTGEGVGGVIFVVDAANPARWPEAREELHHLLHDQQLLVGGAPVLILANKMDLPEAKSVDAMVDALQVDPDGLLGKGIRCGVQRASLLEADGVLGALEWIAANSSAEVPK
uniref:Protein kinase domain-containing protein n=1 Tax=Haptolina ericina TaxID=156174 RepID=A0A7S3AHU0_9EUKA